MESTSTPSTPTQSSSSSNDFAAIVASTVTGVVLFFFGVVLVSKYLKHRKKTRATSHEIHVSNPKKVHVHICTVVDVLSMRIVTIECVHVLIA